MQTLQLSDEALSQLNDLATKAHIPANILVEQLIKKHAEEKNPYW